MARIDNTLNLEAGFNVIAEAPIDSRTRVEYESDLTSSATWLANKAPFYNGLKTYVMETGEWWTLKDKNHFSDKTSGQGWVRDGSKVETITGLHNAFNFKAAPDNNEYDTSVLKSTVTHSPNNLVLLSTDATDVNKFVTIGGVKTTINASGENFMWYNGVFYAASTNIHKTVYDDEVTYSAQISNLTQHLSWVDEA